MISLRYLSIHYSLLFAWAVTLATPQSPSAEIQDLICRAIPGLNEEQIQICKDVPRAIEILQNTQKMLASECAWQFRKELWNCSGLDMPLFSAPNIAGELCNVT